MRNEERSPTAAFNFASSVAADVWHPRTDKRAYEWWYFDALSAEGTEGVIVLFLDNFIYSPRYNANRRKDGARTRFPAVSFTYFRDGKAVYRAVAEYDEARFEAATGLPRCRIGSSSFEYSAAPYGRGYLLRIELPLSGHRRLEAQLEWLLVESDLLAPAVGFPAAGHFWNMAAPRADVTGSIRVYDRRGRESDEIHFRGTGYHDHNLDNRWLARTVSDWHWGRAHFADHTAVFYRYCEKGADRPSTKLLLIRDGDLDERPAEYEEQNYERDGLGIKYPTELRMTAGDDLRLEVRPVSIVDSSFYYLRFLSEITLTLTGDEPRQVAGITEFIAPQTLKYRWLNRLSDMRTGKNGKPPLFS